MAERTSAALEIKDLNVYYGQSHALQGVNLTLNHGVLSVVGRNGMGKTTTCKAIMGLVPVASGTISLFWTKPRRARPGRNRAPRDRLRSPGAAPVAIIDGR